MKYYKTEDIIYRKLLNGVLHDDNNTNYKETNKIIKTVKEKYYNNSNPKSKYLIDCDKHIIDKSETLLVESKWTSLRSRFARFIRKTRTKG